MHGWAFRHVLTSVRFRPGLTTSCGSTPLCPSQTMADLSSYVQILKDHSVESVVIVIAALLFVRAIPWILSPRVPAVVLALPSGALALSLGPDLRTVNPAVIPSCFASTDSGCQQMLSRLKKERMTLPSMTSPGHCPARIQPRAPSLETCHVQLPKRCAAFNPVHAAACCSLTA